MEQRGLGQGVPAGVQQSARLSAGARVPARQLHQGPAVAGHGKVEHGRQHRLHEVCGCRGLLPGRHKVRFRVGQHGPLLAHKFRAALGAQVKGFPVLPPLPERGSAKEQAQGRKEGQAGTKKACQGQGLQGDRGAGSQRLPVGRVQDPGHKVQGLLLAADLCLVCVVEPQAFPERGGKGQGLFPCRKGSVRPGREAAAAGGPHPVVEPPCIRIAQGKHKQACGLHPGTEGCQGEGPQGARGQG